VDIRQATGGFVRAVVYRNTKTTLPNWVEFHDQERRGIAYETDTHFVHLYGKSYGVWVISTGLTVTEAKAGTLSEWVTRVFGAEDIEECEMDVGSTTQGVWRPGLFYDEEIKQGLGVTDAELRLAEQALLLLVQRLDELLLFIEPTKQTLAAFGHKSRELLILACTEAENYWKHYMRTSSNSPNATTSNFSTNDYVKLRSALSLDEYEVNLPRYSDVPPIRPFLGWNSDPSPTKTLPWYDSYNKTKHDRQTHFGESSLWNCIQAVSAVIVLFSVRFSPLKLFHGGGSLATLFNQTFSIELRDCSARSFYAPQVQLPVNARADLICFESRQLIQPRKVQPFKI
jgi:hypothetical protein